MNDGDVLLIEYTFDPAQSAPQMLYDVVTQTGGRLDDQIVVNGALYSDGAAVLGPGFAGDLGSGKIISPNPFSGFAILTDLSGTLSVTGYTLYGDYCSGLCSANGILATMTLNPDTLPAFAPSVPEPSAWAMLLAGFVVVGSAAYRRRRFTPLAVA